MRAKLKEPMNHHESRDTVIAKKKPKKRGVVTYVFHDIEEQIPAAADRNAARNAAENNQEDGDSLSDILQQKERIRSIITPDVNKKEEELLGGKPQVVGNSEGRSPYNGAQLRVVSVNHKKNKKDAIFDNKPDSSNASSSYQPGDKSLNEPSAQSKEAS